MVNSLAALVGRLSTFTYVMKFPSKSIPILLSYIFLVGCGEQEDSEAIAESTILELEESVPRETPDMAAAEAFARKFETALGNGDVEFVSEHLDFMSALDELVSNSNVPPEFTANVKKGAASVRESVIAQVMAANYDYLRMLEDDMVPKALFRVRRDGGIDYAEYTLSESPEASAGWTITDAYTYSVGTAMTELQKNMIAPILAQFDRPMLLRVLGPDGDTEAHLKSVEAVNSMQQHLFAGDAEAAAEVWDNLSDKSKYDKLVLLTYIRAVSTIDETDIATSRYSKAIDAFLEHYPEDPAVNLIGIDSAFIDGDFDKAKELVADLKAKVDDPYLDFFSGFIFLAEGNFEEAERRARAWLAEEPEDIEGWNLLLESGFASGQHEITAEALTKLESDFAMDFSPIIADPEWSPFIESDRGKAWIASRTSNSPTER